MSLIDGIDYEAPLEEIPVGCVKSHFLDSGAFSLWTKAAKYAKENNCGKWDYYDTDEFWEYMDSYAAFVKKYAVAIDLYANVDVIPNPKLTWRNQKYLEDTHGLRPVPVVHYTTDLKWLQRYIEAGHKIIGLGGLVGSTSQNECRAWIDRCFDMVCDAPDRLPKVKVHGFGVTTYSLLFRWPWYSVDSTSWTKVAAYGGILVPHKRKGLWDFRAEPYVLKVSVDSPDAKKRGKHALNLSQAERRIIDEWLTEVNVPFGDKNTKGVSNHHTYRRIVNLRFFEMMRATIPKYPWPFVSTRRKSLWEL